MREYKPLIDNSFFCTTKKDYEFFGVFPSDPKQMVWTSAWAGCNAGYSFIQIKESVRVFTDAFSPKKGRFFRTCQIAIKFSQQRNSTHVR